MAASGAGWVGDPLRRIQEGPGPPWSSEPVPAQQQLARQLMRATCLALGIWSGSQLAHDKMLTIVELLANGEPQRAVEEVAASADGFGAHGKIHHLSTYPQPVLVEMHDLLLLLTRLEHVIMLLRMLNKLFSRNYIIRS